MICPLIYYFYLCIAWLIFFVLDNLIVIKEEGCFEFSLKIPKDANWMTRLLGPSILIDLCDYAQMLNIIYYTMPLYYLLLLKCVIDCSIKS